MEATPTDERLASSASASSRAVASPPAPANPDAPTGATFELGGRVFQGSLRGLGLLNTAALLFGANQVVIKLAEDSMSPDALSVARFGVAALCVSPWLPRALAKPDLAKAALELGLWLTLGYTLQAHGLAETTAARSAVTGAFTVLTVPFVAGLMGRRIRPATWVAAAASVAGVALLCGSTEAHAEALEASRALAEATRMGGAKAAAKVAAQAARAAAAQHMTLGEMLANPIDGVIHIIRDELAVNRGDVMCALSACIFGVHKIRTEKATRAAGPDDGLPLMSVQLLTLCTASALYASPELVPTLTSIASDGNVGGLVEAAVGLPWAPILFMGCITTAGTLFLEVEGLREVSAPLAALVFTAEPLWGAVLAWAFLGERWGSAGWLGACVIVAASAGAQLSGDGENGVRGDPECAEGLVGDGIDCAIPDADET